ncbi:MAG: MOSC domain-containing protein, partial [Longimicrobiales bacterium]
WLKPVRKRPMKPVDSATLVANRGVLGSADQNGRRQVTIISQECWRAVQHALGHDVDPSLRRANLLVSGIDLTRSRGKRLRVGPCLIEIWGETRPCLLMDEGHPGLQDALRPDWSGGVFGVILEGGDIHVGDAVVLLPEVWPTRPSV